MPRKAKQLSAAEVAQLKAPARTHLHYVGGVPGLALQVMPSGSRSWTLRFTLGGRRRDMGLGTYPAVTLAQAREKGRQAREQLDAGLDPIAERRKARSALLAQAAKAVTFEDAARTLIDAKSPEWRSAKHSAQWTATLKAYAHPVIGRMVVSDIEVSHILKILRPIWTTRTETATRLRTRIEAVLDWATASGLRSGPNPARWRGHLDKMLPRPEKISKVKHHAALPVADMPDFMTKLRAQPGQGARALEFTILCAARSGETRGATWDEIDLDAGVWTVPAERMKGARLHRVPLPPAAVDLLRGLKRAEDCPLVFPSPKQRPLSDMTLLAVLKRMEVPVTVHGFRSSFRDWAAERTTFPRELAEQALAHAVGGTEGAYMRSDLLERRREMMKDWARFCASPSAPDNTVPSQHEKEAAAGPKKRAGKAAA